MLNKFFTKKLIFFFIISLLNFNNISYSMENKIRVKFLKGEMKDKYYLAGIEIKLKNNWKTYWKNPGEIGLEPEFIIKEKKNIHNIEILWPVPKKLKLYDTYFYGYDDIFIIPIKIIPKERNKKSFLKLELNLGLCKDICTLEKIIIYSEIDYNNNNFLASNEINVFLNKVPKKVKLSKKNNIKCFKKIFRKKKNLRYEIVKIDNFRHYEFALIDLEDNDYWIKKQESFLIDNKIILKAELISNYENITTEKKHNIFLIGNNKGIIINPC